MCKQNQETAAVLHGSFVQYDLVPVRREQALQLT